MSTKNVMEQLEKNKIKLTINVSPVQFREGLTYAYNKNKSWFNIPGFRKGKAPRRIIEQMYGKDVFYEDATNFVLPDAYEAALDELQVDPVYKPEIELGNVSEAEGAIFFATVYTRPEAEVDGYHGFTYPKGTSEATEEEIQSALRAEQEKNSRQVSVARPAEKGDIATINFEGFIDGIAFEGGKGTDHDLTLGSGQFIPGFEDQLIGANVGDNVSVNVTFPEDYHSEQFSGKAAIFEVEILDIKGKELPEIDDEFAQDVSEFDTLQEYREDLAKRIHEKKLADLEGYKRRSVMRKLIAASSVDVPEAMYLARLDDMMDDFTRQVQSRGMDIENYMRFAGINEQQLRDGWRKQAKEDVNGVLALEAVAKKEGLSIADEEFVEKMKEMLKGHDNVAQFISEMHPTKRKDIERSIVCEKALDFVMEKAIATDEPLEMDIDLEDDEYNDEE